MLRETLDAMPRRTKRIIFFVADTVLIPISLYVAFALRFGTGAPTWAMESSILLFPATLITGGFLIFACRLPYIKLNSFDIMSVRRIALVAAGLSLFSMAFSYMFGLGAPRSVPLIFGAAFLIGSIFVRILALSILGIVSDPEIPRVQVAIYGAGAAGIQLVGALRQAREVDPVAFIDDNPSLEGLIISGLRVYGPDALSNLVRTQKIARILIAMPSAPKSQQTNLFSKLSKLGVEVQILPSYVDIISGKDASAGLRTVTPDELLGRDKVDLNIPEVAKTYAGRSVMVTGAGGSIGSELCRQLVNCAPAKIVLFEQSEYGLYKIDQDLKALIEKSGIAVVPRLGSVTVPERVGQILEEENVDIVLHAAAYKHVPLVEENELEGARNNVLGTQVVADACERHGVERFILISTDKAVRPTNIMGATKRMAELVIQDLQTRSTKTKFAMVRFGNVLGSSGSVLPLFERQIRAGGPVTVTHRDVTRFFMTIPEASRLVLLAGAYSEGGDVFVLDMGQPVKIIDIARHMIEMSGRQVREEGEGGPGIEIQIRGLRAGEKLYEELLINDDSLVSTPHEKILRAEEAMLSQIEVAGMVRELREALDQKDTDRLRTLVANRVDGYHTQEPAETG